MPLESYHIKALCQMTTWFSAVGGLYRLGFEFLSGMCLSGFIGSQTPAVTNMYALAETAETWLGYYRFEITILMPTYPWLYDCAKVYGDCVEAFFKMCLSIAPKLPIHAWPPTSQWIGKCEDFWELRDAGVY